MPNSPPSVPEPKASRVRVWQACDRILRSGRRPTVEGIREVLGGGSPNSVAAYMSDWYHDLGSRLNASESPLAGFPPEALSLMSELWRLAAAGQATTRESAVVADIEARMRVVERDALKADAQALQSLNQELQRHRLTVETSLAEARALLARREGALAEERSRAAALEQALAQARLELEVLMERRRLPSSRVPPVSVRRTPKRRTRASSKGSPAKRNRSKPAAPRGGMKHRTMERSKSARKRQKLRGQRGP